MKIGELAKRTGFSKDTIRYYQELGLFKNHVKQGENNYREFSDEAIIILKLIEESKAYGFTLKENKAILDVRNDKFKKLQLMEILTNQKILNTKAEIIQLNSRIEKLNSLSEEIEKCLNQCL